MDSHEGRDVPGMCNHPGPCGSKDAAQGKKLALEKGQRTSSLPTFNDPLSVKSRAKGNIYIYTYKQTVWVSLRCTLLLNVSQKGAESSAKPNTRLSPAASVTVQRPSACPPLQKQQAKKEHFCFFLLY